MLKFGRYAFHRKEQWDLNCKPMLVVHRSYADGSASERVFCLWLKSIPGLKSGGFSIGRLNIKWEYR